MRRRCGRFLAGVLALAGGCSLSSLDDLQGGPSGARCEEKVDCSGCQGCAKLCTCTAAPDFDQCYQACLQTADAGADAGGSSGGGTSGTSGSGGQGGSSASGGSGASGGTGGGSGGGSGGSGGNGGTGGSGGTGGTGGSSTGGSSGMGGGGPCGPSTGDPCNDCVALQCCDELMACEANPLCYQFAECFSQNCFSDPTQQCAMLNCSSVYGGFADYAAVNNCAVNECQATCT